MVKTKERKTGTDLDCCWLKMKMYNTFERCAIPYLKQPIHLSICNILPPIRVEFKS